MNRFHGGDWAEFQRESGFLPLDFSANISPLGLPAGVKEAVLASLDSADRYPDPRCTELCTALSAHYGIPAEAIVCGNGAADLIFRLVFLLKPKKALVPVPTFTEYEHALSLSGCCIGHVFCREEDDFSLPEAVLGAVTPETDLVFLCNPNNPTGRLIPADLLARILHRCEETDIVLVTDECFMGFPEEAEKRSLLGRLSACPHLVILRAFTKLYAMPGLRLGMALCGSTDLAEQLRSFGQPWPVSVPAQAASLAALQDNNYVNRVRAFLKEERPFLQKELSELGLRVIPGEANFFLFFTEKKQLAAKLREKGILIRDCSDFPGLCPGWYRIAVRTREENLLLLRALKEVLHGS
ncbi:MAG: threonine-phosphate decarboxylase [Oscillospiraceae bacterium]|nr:threonine-phosphate decarboxylase [Oscillospiraceae bacterium]